MRTLQGKGQRLAAAAALLALGAALAACGHHDDDKPPADPTPPVATDAFVTYVSQQVATQSDSAEPASTDGVSVTTPETSEPVPLPGS